MLVLHFDYTSLAAAVTMLRLQRLADDGVNIAFQGIDVLGIDMALPVTLDQRVEIEHWSDAAVEAGLTIRLPSRRPPTLPAHLVGDIAEAHGMGAAWREAVVRAYWTQEAALEDTDVLLGLAGRVGLPSDIVQAQVTDPAARSSLWQRMAAERGRGIGGVPLLEVDGTLLSPEMPEADLRLLADL